MNLESMKATGFWLAVAAAISAHLSRKTAKESLAYQKERDAKSIEQQQAYHKDNLAQREALNERTIRAAMERDEHQHRLHLELIERQKKEDLYPLKEHLVRLDESVPRGALSVFIVPPKQLMIRGDATNRDWNEIHTNALVESVRTFIYNHYQAGSTPHGVYLQGPDILKPGGYRGEHAIRHLQQATVASPTLWLESNRISAEHCAIGMSQWGGDLVPTPYTPLGVYPNYENALKGSMPLSLLFT